MRKTGFVESYPPILILYFEFGILIWGFSKETAMDPLILPLAEDSTSRLKFVL